MKRILQILLVLSILATNIISLTTVQAKTTDAFILSGAEGEYIDIDYLDSISERNFYNTVLHNANAKDLMDIGAYILDNVELKEMVLLLNPTLVSKKSTEAGKLVQAGGGFTEFYKRYSSGNTLPDINKDSMDSQHIDSIENYNNANPHLTKVEEKSIGDIESYTKQLQKLVELADQKKIELKVVLTPITKSLYDSYKKAEVDNWINATASVTKVYDYTYSSVSLDSRYFYTRELAKPDLYNMVLNHLYNKEGYKPEDLGSVIDKGSSISTKEGKTADNSKELLALMFHNIDDSVPNDANISTKRLRQVCQTIKDKGYTTVGIKEIKDYVYNGIELPNKAVVLTFDDGYMSNYTLAYPILKENGQKAVFFPIGHSIGKDEYKDTGVKITPHYTLDQMKEMSNSGVIDFGTHGYDIHQAGHLEGGVVMESILKPEGMDKAEYEKLLGEDFEKMEEIFEGTLGFKPTAMAYPRGERDKDSDIITRKNGIVISFTVNPGANFLVKGLEQSMFNLNRININETVDLNTIFK